MHNAILVTGGAGYIGAHVCKALAKAGFVPIAYDNLSVGHAYAAKWGPFIHADLRDQETLHETFRKFQPKAVLHFASSALVVESIADPGKYYHNNVSSAVALLEAMRLHHVPHLVFSSTCATYGQPQYVPLTESHPQQPINPYGKSKLMIEQILLDFETAYGTRCAILRYFNVAGADLNTEIGENHTPETHLIPLLLQTVLGLHPEFVVYGTDFPTKDGSAIRDYIHVVDLANAHVAALQKLLKDNQSFCVNLGTGTGFSVFEIIHAVETFCAKALPIRLAKRRAGEPSVLVADNSKAKELLGWEMQYSNLPTIIESAWKWHQLLAKNAHLLKTTLSRLEEHGNSTHSRRNALK